MFGNLELMDFKPLLTKKEFKACLEPKNLQKTWYPLTLDVFISFLFRVYFFLSFVMTSSKSLQFQPFSFLVLSDFEGRAQDGEGHLHKEL